MKLEYRQCGYNRLDKIRNVVIRGKVGVVPIKDKTRGGLGM